MKRICEGLKVRRYVMLIALLAGCAPASPPATPAPQPTTAGTGTTATAPALPTAIRWYRRSAEMKALYMQGYRVAGQQLEQLVRNEMPHTWAIITDADETVLDNSLFGEEQAKSGAEYSEDLWNAFVRRQVSTALPGSVAFFQRVHELGGKIVVVTNREAQVCDVTRQNLSKAGLDADLVLCKPPAPAPGDKNLRFQAVQSGTAGLPAMKVVMYLGDNIQDFPTLSQKNINAAALEHFGRDYIVFPNPMYGSWERN